MNLDIQSLPRLGKLSAIVSLNKLSTPFIFLLHGVPMLCTLYFFVVSRKSCRLSFYFSFFFFPFCSFGFFRGPVTDTVIVMGAKAGRKGQDCGFTGSCRGHGFSVLSYRCIFFPLVCTLQWAGLGACWYTARGASYRLAQWCWPVTESRF